jgi:hypothetical protein
LVDTYYAAAAAAQKVTALSLPLKYLCYFHQTWVSYALHAVELIVTAV